MNNQKGNTAFTETKGTERKRGGASEDRRILRTKKNLKNTLLEMMKEIPFEKITVKELCERALTSRITFYNYYADKYALLEDILRDMSDDLQEMFRQREKKNVTNDPYTSFQNLFDSFLDMHDQHEQIFENIDLQKNTMLLPGYYRFLTEHTTQLMEKYAFHLRPNYPIKRISSFLVMGLYSYIRLARDGESRAEVRDQVHALLRDLLDSKIFTVRG